MVIPAKVTIIFVIVKMILTFAGHLPEYVQR
jgi:hypothetical protein